MKKELLTKVGAGIIFVAAIAGFGKGVAMIIRDRRDEQNEEPYLQVEESH